MMRKSPDRQNLLPLSVALLFLLGFILIVGGVVVQFSGRPELGGRSALLYESTMGGGAVCMLLGAWLGWRWSKSQRS